MGFESWASMAMLGLILSVLVALYTRCGKPGVYSAIGRSLRRSVELARIGMPRKIASSDRRCERKRLMWNSYSARWKFFRPCCLWRKASVTEE